MSETEAERAAEAEREMAAPEPPDRAPRRWEENEHYGYHYPEE